MLPLLSFLEAYSPEVVQLSGFVAKELPFSGFRIGGR